MGARLYYHAGMRKTTFVKPLYFCAGVLCLATFGVNCLPALGQARASAAMPGDPKELMLLAARTNGLTGNDVQPWRMKATYKSFDEQGNVKNQGTIEEFWVSPAKHRLTYASGSLSQTMYGSEKGDYSVGGAGMDLMLPYTAYREFSDPLPPPGMVMRTSYVVKELDAGDIKVTCLQQQDTTGRSFGLTWCLGSERPDLRITVNGNGPDVLHRNIVSFQGRSIAGDLKFSDGELKDIGSGKPAFEAHLETIEPLTTIDDAAFVPPPGATPPIMVAGVSYDRNGAVMGTFGSVPSPATPPKSVAVSGGVMASMILNKVIPAYPEIAKQDEVQGTVVLGAVIGKDGRIINLKVIQGPSELQQAALDAVKQWVYRPYLLNGEPVEVMTQINVVFTLGNR
jgi:TonB family protein